MASIEYGALDGTTPGEIADFYRRVQHDLSAAPAQIQRMIAGSTGFVTARADGKLIGIARGLVDGTRGFFAECKLDPAYQGPGAVTRRDGRIEHDENGIAVAMARRVLDALTHAGATRVDVLAWGTEVDFLEELGFRRSGGLVGLTLKADDWNGAGATAPQPATA